MQFRQFCVATFYGWQDSFLQHESGLLDEDVFRQMRSGASAMLSLPGFRTEWETTIRVPGTKFAAFIDDIVATLPAPAPLPAHPETTPQGIAGR
ncbi:MAG: hypothetical protein HY243_01425 [Proteobacteria bacterium]|nr:hypothetical protein [Pseudomonadota bacterium]